MNTERTCGFHTREEMKDAALALLAPLPQYLSPGRARLLLGSPAAHYDESIAGMEGFSRALWVILPMLIGKIREAEPYWELWKQGIASGTDRDNEEYWGDIGDFDQRMVEMAVMGAGMCFAPERFFFELPEKTQDNLCRWLSQINRHKMPENNWKFFRVLVNIGLLTVGREADRALLAADLDELESHYTADGWYFDKPNQRDYYTLWGFHFYTMLYTIAMQKKDPQRCSRFTERTKMILPRFACWFDSAGRAVPYGRSLTYRFAQGSFWAACALSGITGDGIDIGVIKGLLLRNLRFWWSMPVFERDGVLSVGYGYPNLVLSEGYNASGSPYWGLKAFAVLALGEDHPFWAAEEKEYMPPLSFCDREARQLITRDAQNSMVLSYTAGNHAYEHMHEDEKYEKFAYSSQFAFSVVKEAGTLAKGAYDSMLAVRRTGHDLWHARSGCESFAIEEDKVRFVWTPADGIRIETVILPAGGLWHVRKHVIHAACPFEAAEGAFAVPRDRAGKRACDRIRTQCIADDAKACAFGPGGSSGIFALSGNGKGVVIQPEANTNLMVPRTLLPMLTGSFASGETTLVSAVYASAGEEMPDKIPQEVLKIAESC